MGVAFTNIDDTVFWYPGISFAANQSCRVRFGGFVDILEYPIQNTLPVSLGIQ